MKNAIKVVRIVTFAAIIMSTAIACGPPRLKGTVSIDGDPMLGKILTANTTSLGGSGIITYQWTRNEGTVVSTDGATYTLQDADNDAVITVTVIRSDNSGSVTSSPVKAYGYLIGDKGPGGGMVFYRNLDGFTMADTGEKANYLEVADMPPTSLAWASSRFSQTNIVGTERAIGAGRKNTALIIATDATAPAALACKNYTGGGKTDWFLPSSGELNELSKQRIIIFIGDAWSSSQNNSNYAWSHEFVSQDRLNYKANALGVRAVRAF